MAPQYCLFLYLNPRSCIFLYNIWHKIIIWKKLKTNCREIYIFLNITFETLIRKICLKSYSHDVLLCEINNVSEITVFRFFDTYMREAVTEADTHIFIRFLTQWSEINLMVRNTILMAWSIFTSPPKYMKHENEMYVKMISPWQ